MFKQDKKVTLNEKADWSNDLKVVSLLNPIRLSDWIVVYPNSKRNAASDFINIYSQVIRSMKISAEAPRE
jgi:hypothetical protein